ncbi:MAG: response regulator [Bacteroidales bacterium]|nr:response regulator [Bacteroidales bacterium]
MKGIAYLDLVSLLASFSGIVVILFSGKYKIRTDIKLLLMGLLLILLLYYLSLFIEWYGITNALDPYEDLIGAFIPMMWAFIFYAFIQKISNVDLLESEKQLDMALKGTRAGLWDWNTQTGNIMLNERWGEMIGYNLTELEPLNINTWDNLIHPDDLAIAKELLQQHFNGELEFYECEVRLKHKNGKWIWVMNRGMVIEWDKKGKPARMTGTHIDISKQKQVEKELKELIERNQAINEKYLSQNRELTASIEQIKSINKELLQAKEKAEESDRLKSAFLANMSHEIRTPMNGILGFAQLLRNPQLEGDKQQVYINLIQQSGQRMLNIINDLIDISKIEAGQLEVKFDIVDVKDLLQNLYLFFKSEAGKKGLSFSFSNRLANEENQIITDKTKVYQILSNLINNAIKYTESGEINFGCVRAGNTIEFYIRDTGIGIPREYHEKVFERFRQVNTNFPVSQEGSGLGLTISKAYVEKLGGKIWVQSRPGEGSVFSFSVPVDTSVKEVRHQKAYSGSTAHDFGNIVILIVEDDEVSFIYLSELLRINNISTLHARNGKEAIELCKEHPEIKMVLMDIKMPVMNGIEAIQPIKKIRKELPVIVQTAYITGDDKEITLKAGADDYLTKPIREEELFSIIRKCTTH